MKKSLLFLATSVFAVSSFASVQIHLKNIQNDKKAFIASLQDGKQIDAVRLGAYAIVSDNLLTNYPENTQFTVGVVNGATVSYCSDFDKGSQFIFQYKTVTNNVIKLEEVRNALGQKSFKCKKLS